MSNYDFITDGIRFSYSSVSAFDNCAYSFKLMYIDALPRVNNFYAEYGTMTHSCFEQYFSGKLEAFELSQYYDQMYDSVVVTPAPSTPYGMGDKYRKQGKDFFDTFSFPKEDYEILLTEDKIEFNLSDSVTFVARPDLVLKRKENGSIILYDYKTSVPYREDKKTGKEIADKKKLDGYYKQMYIYANALRNVKNFPIDEISLWFPRANRIETVPWKKEGEEKAMAWLNDAIEKIKNTNDFPYNNSSPYFCNNLCSVRDFCEYR